MPNSRLIVKIEGPDAEQAYAELQSNIQYDDLKVNVTRMDELPDAITRLDASADDTGCTDDLIVVSAEALKHVVRLVVGGWLRRSTRARSTARKRCARRTKRGMSPIGNRCWFRQMEEKSMWMSPVGTVDGVGAWARLRH